MTFSWLGGLDLSEQFRDFMWEAGQPDNFNSKTTPSISYGIPHFTIPNVARRPSKRSPSPVDRRPSPVARRPSPVARRPSTSM